MSSKKKSAAPYHAKSTKKSGKGKVESSPVAIDAAQLPVEVAADAPPATDPDRVPLSQAMKKPGKPKAGGRGEKPPAAKPAKAPKPPAEPKVKKLSGLDAAARVLARAKDPMNSKDLIKTMSDQGLWISPGGKTPHSTLYAAMLREINEKGRDARFKKVERGLFAHA